MARTQLQWRLQLRLDAYEDQLNRQFVSLEQLMSQLNSQNAFLLAALG